jgi:hypothetical protein
MTQKLRRCAQIRSAATACRAGTQAADNAETAQMSADGIKSNGWPRMNAETRGFSDSIHGSSTAARRAVSFVGPIRVRSRSSAAVFAFICVHPFFLRSPAACPYRRPASIRGSY